MTAGAEKIHDLLDQHPFVIIGHRGAAGLAPENTLASFHKALDLGCPMIELDVYRISTGADQRLIVIHDDTLERTTSATGPVRHLTPQRVAEIDAGDGQPIPFLEDVLGVAEKADAWVNIELKGPGTAVPVAQALGAWPDLRVLVSSFDHEALATFCAADTKTPVAPLFHRWTNNWLNTARELQAVAVNLSVRIASRPRVEQIRAAGYGVFVYTVNRPVAARRLVQAGASGIFTDRPDRMTAWLDGGRPL